MHIFDVHVPLSTSSVCDAPDKKDRQPSKRDAICLDESDDTLYLDTLDTDNTSELPMATTQGVRFHFDPSMYRFRDNLRATCLDSAKMVQRIKSGDVNTIHLPTGRAITYDNSQDVLHLRFVPPDFRFPDNGRLTSPISAMFESIWTDELASALHHARRVAIDVSQLWPDLAEGQSDIMQDVAYLGCVLQNDLEVLYLVDYCAGRCNGVKAGELMSRDEGLYRKVYGYGSGIGGGNTGAWNLEKQRKPDVFHGVGTTWREVFDIEKMGWSESHPGFVFAEAFSEVVRMQQSNFMSDEVAGGVKRDVSFKGIRVLIAEDENVDGADTSKVLSCGCHTGSQVCDIQVV